MSAFIYHPQRNGYCMDTINEPEGRWTPRTALRCSLGLDHPGPHIAINDGLIKGMWIDDDIASPAVDGGTE